MTKFIEVKATFDGIEREISVRTSAIDYIVQIGNESIIYLTNSTGLKVKKHPKEIIAEIGEES